MEAARYLSDTQPALLHVFQALAEYDALSTPPSLRPYVTAEEVIELTQAGAQSYLSALGESMALEMAKATLCGVVVQVAHTAIVQFGEQPSLDGGAAAFHIKPETEQAKFYGGRSVHGIPVGLLIYAARIQANHWDQGRLTNPVANAVLAALQSHYRLDPSFDLGYVWDWPQPRPITHHIVRRELGWMGYDDYLPDVQSLLSGLGPGNPGGTSVAP